jgi:hypothetical protein
MQLITTTELRTKSRELVNLLLSGKSVDLIHRSKVIAEVRPKKSEIKIMTAERIDEIKRLAKKMNLPKLSYREREKRYRDAMMKKHGQNFS